MFPSLDDVLSTVSQRLTDVKHNLRHHDVTDDAVTLKRPSRDLQRTALIMNKTVAGMVDLLLRQVTRMLLCCRATACVARDGRISFSNFSRAKSYQELADKTRGRALDRVHN